MSVSFTNKMINGISTHFQATDKYKTNDIVLYIRQPLVEEHYTKVALIPSILARGTRKYPTAQKISQAVDDLYGATLMTDVVKKGEEQVIVLRMQLANERYLSDTTPLFNQGMALISEVLMNPVLEDGAFHPSHVQLEKDILSQKLSQIKDDKLRYANKRCVEEMFKNENYHLFVNGSEEQLKQLTPQDLFEYYQEMLQSHPIECFVVGDLDQRAVEKAIEDYLTLPRRDVKNIPQTQVKVEDPQPREVIEKTKISQGKLHIGCRTQTAYQDEDYIPLIVFNGVFGGFPHSKLFTHIREKESLAYYVSSMIESHKGFMMIASGIEFENKDKTIEIVKEELQNIVEGNITQEEMDQTKAMLTNQIKESNDRPYQFIERYFNGIISGRERSSDHIMEEIQQVSVDDIKQVARKVKIDTIYFLTSEEEVAEKA